MSKDMLGQTCFLCEQGVYAETSVIDDINGVLHCPKCHHQTQRNRTMQTTLHDDWQNTVFYCEFVTGGWDNVDPVYKVEEDDELLHIWGGYMGSKPYTYFKNQLKCWSIEKLEN